MGNQIKVNGDTHLPIDTIKYAKPVGEEEQVAIGQRYGIDGSKFNTQLFLTTRSAPKLVQETTDDLSAAGLALVNIGGKFVPAANIVDAKELDKEGRAKLRDKGYTVSDSFRSSVETVNSLVLSKAFPSQVLDRRKKALAMADVNSSASSSEPEPTNG